MQHRKKESDLGIKQDKKEFRCDTKMQVGYFLSIAVSSGDCFAKQVKKKVSPKYK